MELFHLTLIHGWVNHRRFIFVVQGAVSVEVCRSCLPGHYCSAPGLSSPSGPCNPGFYCIQGSRTATPMGDTSGNRQIILALDKVLESLWQPGPPVVISVKAIMRFEAYVCPRECEPFSLKSAATNCIIFRLAGYFCMLKELSWLLWFKLFFIQLIPYSLPATHCC